jgi:hypothetical protein
LSFYCENNEIFANYYIKITLKNPKFRVFECTQKQSMSTFVDSEKVSSTLYRDTIVEFTQSHYNNPLMNEMGVAINYGTAIRLFKETGEEGEYGEFKKWWEEMTLVDRAKLLEEVYPSIIQTASLEAVPESGKWCIHIRAKYSIDYLISNETTGTEVKSFASGPTHYTNENSQGLLREIDRWAAAWITDEEVDCAIKIRHAILDKKVIFDIDTMYQYTKELTDFRQRNLPAEYMYCAMNVLGGRPIEDIDNIQEFDRSIPYPNANVDPKWARVKNSPIEDPQFSYYDICLFQHPTEYHYSTKSIIERVHIICSLIDYWKETIKGDSPTERLQNYNYICCVCMRPECKLQKLERCAGCLCVSYCSREHQKQDWKTHKAICKEIQQHAATWASKS